MDDCTLLRIDDPRLDRSDRIGDSWAIIADVADLDLQATRSRTRNLIESVEQPLHRDSRPGHLTGSALVVDSTCRRTLLLLHAKLGIWVQPGGHADGDANLAAVALREASEETGINDLRVLPCAIDLDIHRVDPPAEEPHFHHDVRFLVVAPPDAEFVGNHESIDHRWVDLDRVADMGVDEGVVRLAAKGIRAAVEIGIC